LVFILHPKTQCQLNQLDLLGCAVPHYDVQLLVNLWYLVMAYGQYGGGETYRTGIVESLPGVGNALVALENSIWLHIIVLKMNVEGRVTLADSNLGGNIIG